jgi:GDPmannose 4,6-dehydratase
MMGQEALPMRGRKVLIFGAAGQDGAYVELSCRRRGAEVVGFSRSTKPSCDVSQFEAVENIIREARPDYVFHLAAESRTSHDALFANHQAIADGAVNILEAVRRHVPQARVLLAGSGLQFVNQGHPIHETAPFIADSPYAAARIYATYLARYYRERMGLRTYVAYLFHHESPSRSARHTSKMIALAAAHATQGSGGHITLGDITVEKEWAFAGDIAEGMVWLAIQDQVSEAVVGTGVGHTIRDWAEACYACVGLDWQGYVSTKPGFVPEYPRLVSDPRTLRGLGWQPRVSMTELARIMVEAARKELVESVNT